MRGSLKICDADIHHNTCDTRNGGAISIRGGGTAWFSGCNFWRNTSGVGGGAIYSEAGGIRVANCAFLNNRADANGGAILLDVTSSASEIVNSTFTENVAGLAGSGIAVVESTLDLRHCTVAGNGEPGATGIATLQVDDGAITVGHCILGPDEGPSLILSGGSLNSAGYNLDADKSIGLSGPGDLFGDPELTPVGLHGGRVYTMLPRIGSPALDFGQAGIAGAPQTDARGAAEGA